MFEASHVLAHTFQGAAGDLLIEGARQHNLKNITLRIPHNAVTAITGVSGSGKSSLAFDTLFAEGQWRYVESLSTYARMFLERLDRPDVDRLVNIRPAIAIEQKNPVRTARSTVGTATEIADLLRLLFAKVGRPICPVCGTEARAYHPGDVAETLLQEHGQSRAVVLFPVGVNADQDLAALVQDLVRRGFFRLRVRDEIVDVTAETASEIARLLKGCRELEVVLDRLVLREDDRTRLVDTLETAFRESGGRCIVEIIGAGRRRFAQAYSCQSCGRTFETPKPALFSFNHPLGACPACKGFGNILHYDEDLIAPDRTKSLAGGAIEPWTKPSADWWQKQMLLAFKRRGFDVTRPYNQLSQAERTLLWDGDSTGKGGVSAPPGRAGAKVEGIKAFFKYLEGKRYKLHVRVMLSRYRSPVSCDSCKGTLLRPEALAVRVGSRTIAEVTDLTIAAAAEWARALPLSNFEGEVAKDILVMLTAKLGFLLRVGLGYLTLSRQTRTLSGGEAQRINLANQLGSQLVGTLYVLDEPSIGLHPRDTMRLVELCRELARAGNTVVVVEHDREFIAAADHVVELGPGSGERGGEIVFAGSQAEFQKATRSLTARYVTGREVIPLPPFRRAGRRHLVLVGAREHNLKDVTVRIPLHTLTVVSGVSGSGKSTLVHDTLYRAVARAFKTEFTPPGAYDGLTGLEYLKGVRLIDQAPIGRTPRSNPVTYVKAFDEIRKLYAAQPRSRALGLDAGAFSFNVPGGRCESCQGDGFQKLEMYFFEDVYVTCQECEGRRYRPDVLTVRYRGRSIGDVLSMTVDDAVEFFAAQAGLARRLRVLQDVGLGYLRLGQPATTLSGGEAQRLKLAAELGARAASEMLYIMDEPTTGLHLDDVKKLLGVLNRLD